MTVPLYSARCCSSQATDSASRWLVGSSRRRRSGPRAGGARGRRGASRRRTGRRRTRRRAAAQGVHRLVELLVDAPAVDGVDLVLEARELLSGLLGVVRREVVEARHEVADLREAVFDVAAHVLGLVELRLLLEVTDRDARREVRLAAVLLVDAGHHLEDGRLARAVVTEHADLRSVEEREGEVLEDRLVRRMHLAEMVHLEHVLRSHEPRVPGLRQPSRVARAALAAP